jgi:hypothetical protein
MAQSGYITPEELDQWGITDPIERSYLRLLGPREGYSATEFTNPTGKYKGFSTRADMASNKSKIWTRKDAAREAINWIRKSGMPRGADIDQTDIQPHQIAAVYDRAFERGPTGALQAYGELDPLTNKADLRAYRKPKSIIEKLKAKGTSASDKIAVAFSEYGDTPEFWKAANAINKNYPAEFQQAQTQKPASPYKQKGKFVGPEPWNDTATNTEKNNNVNSDLRIGMEGFAKEFRDLTGEPFNIESGKRSNALQKELYGDGKTGVAKPGTSPHEHGNAFDVDYGQGYRLLGKAGFDSLLGKHGLDRPLPQAYEAQHVELKAPTNTSVAQALQNAPQAPQIPEIDPESREGRLAALRRLSADAPTFDDSWLTRQIDSGHQQSDNADVASKAMLKRLGLI